MTADELKRNIDTVMQNVARASRVSGQKVTVVAATKTVPSAYINAAISFGVTDIGENRVQEYISKRDGLDPVTRHFIGTLQRNKAKYLVGDVDLIQSVNSAELALEVDRLAAKRNIVQSVLIEVNVAGEICKTGAPLDKAEELIAYARTLKNIAVKGIMSVPSVNAEDGEYKTLYALYEKHRDKEFDTLSVGMSGDYEKAIVFGSNMVRIGTAMFGKRVLGK